ncbi:hypothetical protein [Clostridium sp. UBA1056]|uniref:hypothetical protein n=1 Tax=unclassified Clostridium TaxID=2614128 RepID=UPI003217A3B8
MKKPKLTTICSLAITIYFLVSFIFIHANPIRVARRYTLRNGYFTETLKGTAELEYTSDDKGSVMVRLFYEDNRISVMDLYKTKLGLWFTSHIGI